MRARAVFLRLLGVASILFGVFFASFFIAVTMRHSSSDTSGRDLPEALAQADEPAVEVLDIVSTNAGPVPITVPSTGEIAPLETEPPLPVTEPSKPLPPLPQLDPVFDSLLSELGSTLAIPVRLPIELDTEAGDWAASIGAVSADSYVIHLDAATLNAVESNDSGADRISTFTARLSRQLSPQLPAGTAVPLPNGLTGVLSDSSCGAGCNSPFIIWIEDGVRYSVGSRVASGADILDLAWRSIDTALPTPSGPDVCGLGAPKHDGQVARTITTALDDRRSMHWIAVCSALGIDFEIVEAPGEVRWQDIDADGTHDAVVRYDDGTSTIFVIDNNRPRSVIDASTGGRLLVADLKCVGSTQGTIAVDAVSGERLDFVTTSTARRISDETLNASTFADC